MATRYNVANSTNFGQAASWHDGVGGASGAPADTDTLYLNAGSGAYTAGLDQTGIDLTLLSENIGFSGRIGGVSEPLKIECNQGVGTYDKGGNGIHYISIITTGGGAGTIKIANLRSGTAYLGGGTISALNVFGGTHFISETAVLNNLPVILGGGEVTINYKGSDLPDITVNSGKLICYRSFGTMTVNGGSVTIQVMDSTAMADTALIINGGSVNINAGGTLPLITGNGGNLSFAGQVKPITVTNRTWAGTQVRYRYGANGMAVTYTNDSATPTVPPDTGQ